MALTDQSWLIQHVRAYQENPIAAHDWDSTPVGGHGILPTLLLTTTGRTSGVARSIPLLYQPCGEGYIVVGSRGGSPRHPDWYLNLVRHPDCTAQVGRLHCTLRARTLEGEERARFWSLMTACWPIYNDYQKRTAREIPVIMLSLQGPPALTA
jgi:deazaflavin-dependent oxidoreductase (nitroreductase family)